MRKGSILTVAFLLSLILLIAPQAFNNATQPPTGYTNAPGELNCSASGCHVSTPVTNRNIFRIDILSRPATYDTAVTYNMFVNNSAGTPAYGFEVTAVDGNGFPAGNFILNSTTTTSLNTGGNSRQYVGHNNANSTNAWAFKWKPTRYVGPVTFYIAGLGANNDGAVTGDQTYLDTLRFAGQGQPASLSADFTINNTTVCVGDAITYTNSSTGTITTYNWNFGAGASPATAGSVGPHSVTYSTTGTKTITLTVGDGILTDTETKTVTVVSAPTANAGSDTTICAGGSASLRATGGTTYAWSNGAGSGANVTVSPLTTTTYTVTATSGSCTATDNVVVFVNPRPTADAGVNDTVCLGQPASLTATGGVSYVWNTTQTTATITAVIPAAGTYTAVVTVTDGNGCKGVDSAQVIVRALPIVNVPDVSTCGTGSATLDAGSGFASYLWSNTDATQTTTVTTTGSYTVTVTDAFGCANTDNATATILSNLVVTLNDTTICPGGSVTLNAGYPGATYLWSNNSTQQTITVSAAGTYSVTVTSGGCNGTEDAVVSFTSLPPVGAGADAVICAGDVASIGDADSVNLVLVQAQNFNGCGLPSGWTANALSGSANWLFNVPSYGGANGFNGSCLASFNDDDAGNGQVNRVELLSPSFDATTYGVLLVNLDVHFREYLGSQFSIQVWDGTAYQNLAVYTSTINGTSLTNFQNVTFDLVPYANANMRLRFVYDDLGGWEYWAAIDNFAIGGVPAGIYSWSPTTGLADPNSPVTTAQPLTTTSYVLTANLNGCTKTDTVTVTVNTSPAVTLTGIASSYCANVNIDYALTGTPVGGTFSGPGVTGSNFNPSDAGAGTHNVVYEYFDAGLGCAGRDTILVTVNPIPAVLITTANTFICFDEPAFTLVATPAGGTFSGPGVSGGVFSAATAGVGSHTVTYNYTSSAGCANSTSITYNVVNFTPSFSGLGSTYCASSNTPVTLTGSPLGGTFSGPGITGNDFDPSAAGAGVHDIAYVYDSLLGYTVDTNFTYNILPTGAGAVTYNYVDNDDELSNAIPIGFSFNFFGQDYTQLKVSTNGFLTFDVSSTGSAFSNQTLPNNNVPNAVVAFMWDDLELSGFEYFVTGTAPNRAMVINFDAFHFFSPSAVQAQIVLQETTNEIEIHCINCIADDGGPSATQGIENATGTQAFAVPGRNNTDWTSIGASVRFIPSSCAFTTIQQVTVSGVSLDITDTTICSGDSVTITASGTSSYVWSHGPTTAAITVAPADTTVYTVTGSDGACTSAASATVNVRPGVNASLSGLNDTICSGDEVINLVGNPSGGVFFGNGVSGATFDPSQATANAVNTISYAVSNAFGCADTATYDVFVSLSPTAQFTLADSTYCLSALPVTLTATPAGGTFTGPGISNGTFVPYFAGVGVHDLAYRVAITGGCDAVDTVSITVYDLPTVTFDPIATQYCVQSDSVELVATPAGGTFAGVGVSGTSFNPTTAGVGGPYILSYTFVDSNGCSNNNVQLTEVVNNPILQWVGLRSTYCVNGDSINLVALPAGGTFSGNGVSGTFFNPATAGAGAQTISYTYTDGAGCAATLDAPVTVNDVLPIGIDNLDSTYCVNAPLVVLSGFPAGGVFSGNGVVGGVFSPDTAGTGGPYVVTYTYTDVNGCITSTSASTRIKPATNLLLSGLNPEYCIEDDVEIALNVAPLGGTLYGSGISGTGFNPSTAGFGEYVLTYEFTNSEGCTSYTSYTVSVRSCTGIDELDAQVSVGLYPNPTTGVLNFGVEGLDGNTLNLMVFSVQGQLLMKEQYDQVDSNSPLQLDMATLAVGTYLVQIQSDNYSSVHRVVISR